MNHLYRHAERRFENIASGAMAMLGNSITFMVAIAMVIFWLTNKKFYTQDIHDSIGDVILGFTFISLFVIQKSFNRFSTSLHLKVNELVASHEPANNVVISAEQKTEKEIQKLSEIHAGLIKEQNKAEQESNKSPSGI
jgi:low affinity Fe/Cu permease